MKWLIVFALITAAAGFTSWVFRQPRPVRPALGALARQGPETRPKVGTFSQPVPIATDASRSLPTRAAANAAASAGRMVLPGGSFLLTAVSLVSPDDNHLTEAAVDILKLQPAETQAVESVLAVVSEEMRALRLSRGGVHRQEDGSITFDRYPKEEAAIIAAANERLQPVLDEESSSALRAVGLKHLLTSPSMLGLVSAEPIPEDPATMLVRVRDEALTFRQKLSRAAVDSRLAP